MAMGYTLHPQCTQASEQTQNKKVINLERHIFGTHLNDEQLILADGLNTGLPEKELMMNPPWLMNSVKMVWTMQLQNGRLEWPGLERK